MNNFNKNSILLVDDDEISNLFNKIFIGKLNLDVQLDIALNGQEALDFLKAIEVDSTSTSISLPCLLLLDIKMPKMNGWAFLDAYEQHVSKEIRDQVTIVMLTTSQDEGDRIKALKNSTIKQFIQKPLSEEKFRLLYDTYCSDLKV